MPLINQNQNQERDQASKTFDNDPESINESINALKIKNWLVFHLSTSLELDPQSINVDQDFTEYGLNSIEMVNISGELEEYLGCRLDPTLVLDYPNIQALSDYLANDAMLSSRPQPAQSAQEMLANLDEMSDEDVDKLLNTMLTDDNDE